MAWLIPSVIATMVVTGVLVFCYLYLYFEDRKKYLGIWSIGWVIYLTRYFFLLGLLLLQANPALQICYQSTTLVSAALILYGSYLYIGKKFPPIFLGTITLAIVWIFISVLYEFSFMIMHLPINAFLAMTQILTGYNFYKYSRSEQKEAIVVGVACILLGIHTADYPFLGRVIWFAPWGYLIAALLGLIIALGMINLIFKKNQK